jgi:hypothetical protein
MRLNCATNQEVLGSRGDLPPLPDLVAIHSRYGYSKPLLAGVVN